ncbi:unnamed protein product [Prorocentrum cordatum]|uniref:Uncharacterized protein n=1 Tax=Prorocentrum cordatum TaxID=2364126 RepID=A0ABN9YG62_9DINO|nr:unnamed protein product [Polarella glacialis]
MNYVAFASLAVLLAGYCCVADDQTTTAEEANFATSADDRTTTMQETNPTSSTHDQITTMEESNPTTSAHYQITTTQEANLTKSAHDQITSTEQANPTTNAHDQITTMEQTNPTPSTAMAITTSGIAMAITTPSDATSMSVATSTVDGAGVLPTPPPTPAAPPAPTANNSQWFILQQATVRVSVDHTMCEGIVLAAHPQLPAEIECGEACEKWTTLRNSVEAAVIAKVVDMTLDVIDIPMSFIASTTHHDTFADFGDRTGYGLPLSGSAYIYIYIYVSSPCGLRQVLVETSACPFSR